MKKGAQLVLKTVKAIEKEDYHSLPQPEDVQIKHAPKIFKETCKINWDQPSKKIIDFVRGLSPYPTAWTIINGKTFKVYSVSTGSPHPKNSEFITDNKNFLHLRTSDGWLSIDELQPEGKRRMKIDDFFRGNKI
jgi:methionyl-tRNA formyltransferase